MNITESQANLPITVTISGSESDTSSQALPAIFKAGAVLEAQSFLGGATLKVMIHKVQGHWIYCDFAQQDGANDTNAWLNVVSLGGWGWKTKP